jgi:putative nucleotidyltransferase with HDIG domain
MNTDIIHKYVMEACKNRVLGTDFFDQHILVVVNFADQLAENLGADREIVNLSAYLHDIAAVLDFNNRKNHPITGADLAEQILSRNNYPPEKIIKVKKCITTHSSPVALGNGLIEEVCLSNADALSQINNPAYWLYFFYNINQLNYAEGTKSYLSLIDSNWKRLIDPAKHLIEKKYLLTKQLLA